MDTSYIRTIVLNIEIELARVKTAVNTNAADAVTTIDDAGERISSMGDMLRDAV